MMMSESLVTCLSCSAAGQPNSWANVCAAAKREFAEELGIAPAGEFVQLNPIKQKGGKIVQAWAFEGDCDPSAIKSNTFSLEWPPRSGRMAEFPEVDRAGFFPFEAARE